MRAGADRAVRARRREGVGRVESDDDVEVVAKRSNAALIEASVEALMRCCLAREEGGGGCCSLGAGKRGGGARERRLGGWHERGFRLGFYFILRKERFRLGWGGA